MYSLSYYNNSNVGWSELETRYLRTLYICCRPSIKNLSIEFRRRPEKIIERLKQMKLM